MVPRIGLEPTRLYSRNILSVVRLPISPRRLSVRESTAKRNPYPHYQPPPSQRNYKLDLKTNLRVDQILRLFRPFVLISEAWQVN